MDGDSILTDSRTDPLASDLVVACEVAWRTIQSHHSELPDVVMLLGTGVERGRLVKLGHWWGGRWLADGGVRGEVLLAGEALHLKPEAVFEVLLHESAHGLNAARGIKDTSRGGRYHNAKFKSTASEVGLTVEQMDPYGFAKTALRPETADRYSDEIARLASTMRIARRIPSSALAEGRGGGAGQGEQEADSDESSPRDKVKPAECGCGRRMRMAPSVFAQGPVTCGNCGADFLIDREAGQSLGDNDRIANDFVARRAAQLKAGERDDPQVALLSEVARGANGLDDLFRLGAWRESLNTDSEEPIVISREEDRVRWDALARAALIMDGTIHGPGLHARGGLELRAGDHVVVNTAHGDHVHAGFPEDGVLGVVTAVDLERDSATVDFATAGSFIIGANSDEVAALTYSYCELVQLLPPTPMPALTARGSFATPIDIAPDLDTGLEL